MLKNKLKSLEKDVKQIRKVADYKVYIVDVEGDGFIIWEGGKEILRCNQEELDAFEKKRPGSVFIINDIPDTRGDEVNTWMQ